MKYWVFHNNQVIGPFDREAISQVADFSSETLVCSEGRKGTQMGDWQRAGVVPELAEALLAATHAPVLARTGIERGFSGALPPEPTLRDLAVLGSLQERIATLENNAVRLEDEMRARDTEIARLKVEIDQRGRVTSELQARITDFEVRAPGLSTLREELDRAREEARSATARLEVHEHSLQELRERISRSPALPEQAANPFGVQTNPAFAPIQPAASPQASWQGPQPAEDMASGSTIGQLAAPWGPRPSGLTPGTAGSGTVPAALETQSADPLSIPDSALPPGEAAPPPLVSLAGSQASAELPALERSSDLPSSDLASERQAPKRRMPLLLALVALAIVGSGGFYYWSFMRPRPMIAPLPVPGAPTTQPPAAPSPQGGSPPQPASEAAVDLTQAAVDFVKEYQIPGRQETVAQLLESRYPTTGRLSPWMVEKLDNDKYQVNFWASQSEGATGPKPVFQFQVRMRSKLLEGLNPPAITLLNDGSVPASEAPRQARPERRSRRAPPQGGSPPQGGGDAAAAVREGLKAGQKAAAPKTPSRRAAPADAPELPGEEPEAPADTKPSGVSKSREEATLDQLLVPGLDQKAPVRRK